MSSPLRCCSSSTHFSEMAEGERFEIWTPIGLAKKFDASIYASVRQYVSKNHRACAVVVLNTPELIEGDGFRATLRRAVQSQTFTEFFGAYPWRDVYTPDDEIGAFIPLQGRHSWASGTTAPSCSSIEQLPCTAPGSARHDDAGRREHAGAPLPEAFGRGLDDPDRETNRSRRRCRRRASHRRSLGRRLPRIASLPLIGERGRHVRPTRLRLEQPLAASRVAGDDRQRLAHRRVPDRDRRTGRTAAGAARIGGGDGAGDGGSERARSHRVGGGGRGGDRDGVLGPLVGVGGRARRPGAVLKQASVCPA